MNFIDRIKMMNNAIRSLKDRMLRFANAKRHHISFSMFVAGFIMDNIALPAATDPLSHMLIGIYLSVIISMLFVTQYIEERSEVMTGKIPATITLWSALLQQLCLGGLFSALFIFYMRSSSLSASWFFLLLLALAALGNELFRSRLARLEFLLATIFLVLYAYLIYALPVLFTRLSPGVFYLSGMLAVLISGVLVLLLLTVAPRTVRGALSRSGFATIGLLLLFNGFYAANIIPPIPLVLKQAEVYHAVSRDAGGDFRAIAEATRTGGVGYFTSSQFHATAGSSAFVFTAVYAPSMLTTPLVHEWQRLVYPEGKWETKLTVEFPILGGRENGYRGYSEKTNIEQGEWRVIVKTGDGRKIGTKRFTVVNSGTDTPLREVRL